MDKNPKYERRVLVFQIARYGPLWFYDEAQKICRCCFRPGPYAKAVKHAEDCAATIAERVQWANLPD